eukprot:1134099-Pelagomonas_calceolata.AAC.2
MGDEVRGEREMYLHKSVEATITCTPWKRSCRQASIGTVHGKRRSNCQIATVTIQQFAHYSMFMDIQNKNWNRGSRKCFNADEQL